MATRKKATPASEPRSIDDYLAGIEPAPRAALEKLRRAIAAAAPDAEEGWSYGLPAFRLGGRPLAGFAAAARHCSYFPMSGAVIAAHADELAGYDTSKGTIRFAADAGLPAALVRKLVAARRTELEGDARRPKRSPRRLRERGAGGRRMSEITYRDDAPLSVEQAIDLYRRSTLGERRPVDRPDIFEGMLANANLTVTAWDGDRLVGISRTLTDFTYVAYLADLAVDEACQRQGIGRRLIEETRRRLGPECDIVLLAAPKANEYYAKLGFEHNPRAWVLKPR